MAPFKEEGGGASKMRVLHSVSEQLAGGGWVTSEILCRVTYVVSPESRQVHTVEQGDGRWGDRRQTQLPWYQKPESQQGEGKAPEAKASPATQEAEGSQEWLVPQDAGAPRSSGSRPTSLTASTLPRRSQTIQETPEPSSSHSPRLRSAQPPKPKPSRSSKTPAEGKTRQSRTPPLRTSRARAIDSDE